ncbi:MAG: hypothetical protein WC729_16880 [Sphingomonas sp.]|jgi:hypothetical protein|uniref:hypothetical protein n=1 Tax=Sphingomonas sp. TaxID=28214 RepID=UPI0035642A5F
MTNYLQIDWLPDDDWNDEIHVGIVSNGFAAKSGAYYAHRRLLADFGTALDRYPIGADNAPELFIGYGRQVEGEKEAIFDIPEVRIRIEPLGRTGRLLVVALVKDQQIEGQSAELRMETNYSALHSFREELRAAEGPPMHRAARLE